jgi:hypothetical protein
MEFQSADQDHVPYAGAKDAFGIVEFCERHSLSTSYFFKLLREHRAPRCMRIGRRTLISKEAAAAWRREMEEADVLANAQPEGETTARADAKREAA